MTANGTTPQPSDELEADIARQREELAATVGQLQAKLDVKARARDKAAELQDRATTDSGKPRPELVAATAVVVLLLGALIWRRRTTR